MALDHLLIHPAAKAALESLAASPPHALLLSGQDSTGRYAVASAWATLLNPSPEGQRIIAPDEKHTIGIETIRTLYRQSRGKHTGTQTIIIRDADAMTAEAQNAFLKLLEEPPTGVTFVLTATQQQKLLPTVLSRAQHVTLHPLPASELRRHTLAQKPHISDQDLAQLLFIADGRPSTLQSLLDNTDALNAERERMQLAKSLLSDPLYNRYLAIGKMATNRDECQHLLDAMMLMAAAQLRRPQPAAESLRWAAIGDLLQKATQNIRQNGNVKAQLLALFSAY